MNDYELLQQQMILKGIHLWPEHGKLRYAGSQQQITPELLQTLRAHKDALLDLLCQSKSLPLSHGQKGLWAIQQLAPHSSAYHLSLAFQLHGCLDIQLLQDVLQLLVGRHQALRTHFCHQGNDLQQQVQGYQRVTIEQVEALGWGSVELQTQLQAYHRRPFDLEQGPLLRTTLFHHTDRYHTLLLTLHHIIIDGPAHHPATTRTLHLLPLAPSQAAHRATAAPTHLRRLSTLAAAAVRDRRGASLVLLARAVAR